MKPTTDTPNIAAFPLPVETIGTERFTQNGMSLRDYFAAHAPSVPEWFRIDYQMQYPTEFFHAPFTHGGSVHRSDHCEKCIEWAEAQDTHRDNQHAEADFVEMKRFIAWRWFYAEAMLKTRP